MGTSSPALAQGAFCWFTSIEVICSVKSVVWPWNRMRSPTDFLMVHFHRGDLLGEVGRVAVEPNAIADRQRALRHAHDGDARPLEVVDHGPDQLFRHRPSSRASPTTIWCRLRGRYLIATCVTHRAGSTV